MKKAVNENQSEGTSRKSGSNYQQLPYTEAHNDGGDGAGGGKKKKLFIGGGVGLLAIVAIVLIVVFATGKGGSSDDHPDDPPTPPVPDGFNPYYVNEDNSTQETTVYSKQGVLLFNTSFPTMQEFHTQAKKKQASTFLKGSNVKDDLGVGVDSHNIVNSIGVNNNFIKQVQYLFGQSSYKRTVLSLSDNENDARFDIPDDVVGKQSGQQQFRLDMAGFEFNHDPFTFKFTSTRTGETLIDTTGRTFLFQDKFIQIDMEIPSGHIYGFGERETNFELGKGAWTMWPTDNKAEFDTGLGGKQLQGMHPFCLIKSGKSDEFFGIFFRSSNAQSPIVSYRDDKNILSYITTGGNLDINFFMRGSAKDIIAEYQQFIGLPKLVPFWAMGFHASGNGWHHLDKVKDIVSDYAAHGVPLESVWLDGNYMEDFKDFSLGKNFTDLKVYTNELHGNGQKVVVQLYGGLGNDPESPNQYVVNAAGALIMANSTTPFSAQTLSNHTVFLDWFQQNASNVWADGLFDMFENLVEFDGIQLDMNTPTIFCEGGHPLCANDIATSRRRLVEEDSENTDWYQSFGSDMMGENSTYYLPFIPQKKFNLDHQTISLNATHNATKNYTSGLNKTYSQYDVHSLFGHMQAKVTHEILSNATYNNRNNSQADYRKLIASSSTFAGTGQYAGHNLGKMTRTWDHMKYSIAQIMNFNMFGIPYTGADVCGQQEDSSTQSEAEQQEICARWYQLSTFYPLARTNRDRGSSGIQIEPYDLPATNNYNMIAKLSVYDRYAYARFVYGCLFDMSTNGGTCFDPLLFHYPDVTKAYENIENTFIVADILKVSPILEALSANQTYQSFFPRGRWVDLDGYEVVEVTDPEGGMVDLTPTMTVKKHLKPGGIIPVQYNLTADGQHLLANSTDQLALTEVNLVVNRDHHGYAEGKLFVDDGKNQSELTEKDYEYYKFKMVNKTLQKFTLNNDKISEGRGNIKSIVIADAENLKNTENAAACMIDRSGFKSVNLSNPVYNETTKTLTIKNQDDKPINVYQMQAVILRDTSDQYSLCDVTSAGWHVDPESYNATQMGTETAQVKLISANYPDLNFTMDLKLGGDESRIVNIKIKPDLLLGDDVFQVPEDIVDVQNAIVICDGLNCELNKFVKINMSPTPDHILTIFNGQEESPVNLWQLNSFIQDKYINTIDAVVLTQNGTKFHGVLGLAERTSNDLFLGDGVYSLWTRDEPNPIEQGELPASNNYGVHPFYMTNAPDGTWFGVYTNLASAQDWWISNDNETGMINLTMIATGGIADITIVFGDDPIMVTREYHRIVGSPVLTPMWALGWHQCKWGYQNTQDLRDVLDGYNAKNLPLDTLWSDIDYMEDYKDFTIDQTNFGDLPAFVEEIHENNLQFIPIIDAGIAQRKDQGYSVYDTGVEQDVFIKAYENGPDFTGEVWPVDAVYPNFFHNTTIAWWKKNLDDFSNMINFDGLWQDMNEASNFCNGVCYKDQAPPHLSHPKNHHIPFTPTGRDLETKSMPLDAYHETTSPDEANVHEIDAHSLYGTMQTKASHEWFVAQDRRTMIIERSSFSGLGKFGSRWLGDNFSQYNYMGFSVTGIMMHNIIGIPLAGADICGFIGDTNAELCTRWYQVGAFYPFSRNHNNLHQISQEPYMFDNYTLAGVSYTDMIRNAMQTKLALVPYYYTEMSMISKSGGAFYRPMFFDFPEDPNAYLNQTHNVMLGSGMKASFQSTENETVTETDYYFPNGIWCSVFNKSGGCVTGPSIERLPSRIYQYYAHIKDGAILPLQTDVVGKSKTVTNVHEVTKNPLELHINTAINENMECVATGRFLSDDGNVLNTTDRQNIYQFDFSATNGCGVENEKADIEWISLNITQLMKANSLDSFNVTALDYLGKIVIYNTAEGDFVMSGKYSVTVNYVDASKAPVTLNKTAEFNQYYNQTILEQWTPEMGDEGKRELPMFEIASFNFTAAPSA